MKVLLRSAKIIQPGSKSAAKTDILIEKGMITRIGRSLKPSGKTRVIESDDLHVSPGWFDMKANYRDPGEEVKEDLMSGARAAAAGGFTGVLVMPSTAPPLQDKSDIEYIRKRSSATPVDMYPAGAMSRDLDGKDITEMYDMKMAGAAAFTDDKSSVSDSGLMLRALQYAKNIGTLVITCSEDTGIISGGQVNEGVNSTLAGFIGAPSLAEEISVSRDIRITRYVGGRIHFSCISTEEAIKLIKEARKDGIDVTCDVALHHLFFDDSEILNYDTNFKVYPPLRSSSDVKALRKAIRNGLIDAVCSDHSPQDIESKDTEFDFASVGMIGQETLYPALNTILNSIKEQELLVNLLCTNPRRILGIETPLVKEGVPANITLFDPTVKWTFSHDDIRSRSKNSPFIGQKFTGKVLGILNRGELVLS
jgi:dihydroorotase